MWKCKDCGKTWPDEVVESMYLGEYAGVVLCTECHKQDNQKGIVESICS